ESLFTFLEYDGIPWENNTAERALRHLTVQEKISGFFYKSLMPDYLRLLGIRQTCRFQGKSFFKFLFSGETDLDRFEARKRKRSQVCTPAEQPQRRTVTRHAMAMSTIPRSNSGRAENPSNV